VSPPEQQCSLYLFLYHTGTCVSRSVFKVLGTKGSSRFQRTVVVSGIPTGTQAVLIRHVESDEGFGWVFRQQHSYCMCCLSFRTQALTV
jgi:hypothetical protein